MLVSPAGSLGLVASSSEAMRLLELFELQAQEGPCLDAFRIGEPVGLEDLEARLRACARNRKVIICDGPGGTAGCRCAPSTGTSRQAAARAWSTRYWIFPKCGKRALGGGIPALR